MARVKGVGKRGVARVNMIKVGLLFKMLKRFSA